MFSKAVLCLNELGSHVREANIITTTITEAKIIEALMTLGSLHMEELLTFAAFATALSDSISSNILTAFAS